MNLKDRSEAAVQQAGEALGADLSEDQRAALAMVIQQAMADAMKETAARSGEAARNCCSHDQDMAHKIAEQIQQSHKALIANLSSLR